MLSRMMKKWALGWGICLLSWTCWGSGEEFIGAPDIRELETWAQNLYSAEHPLENFLLRELPSTQVYKLTGVSVNGETKSPPHLLVVKYHFHQESPSQEWSNQSTMRGSFTVEDPQKTGVTTNRVEQKIILPQDFVLIEEEVVANFLEYQYSIIRADSNLNGVSGQEQLTVRTTPLALDHSRELLLKHSQSAQLSPMFSAVGWEIEVPWARRRVRVWENHDLKMKILGTVNSLDLDKGVCTFLFVIDEAGAKTVVQLRYTLVKKVAKSRPRAFEKGQGESTEDLPPEKASDYLVKHFRFDQITYPQNMAWIEGKERLEVLALSIERGNLSSGNVLTDLAVIRANLSFMEVEPEGKEKDRLLSSFTEIGSIKKEHEEYLKNDFEKNVVIEGLKPQVFKDRGLVLKTNFTQVGLVYDTNLGDAETFLSDKIEAIKIIHYLLNPWKKRLLKAREIPLYDDSLRAEFYKKVSIEFKKFLEHTYETYGPQSSIHHLTHDLFGQALTQMQDTSAPLNPEELVSFIESMEKQLGSFVKQWGGEIVKTPYSLGFRIVQRPEEFSFPVLKCYIEFVSL